MNRPSIHPWKLRQASRVIHSGGIIAYPTEAVYGLGCDPLDGATVQRLFELKGRPATKGLILIAADFEQLRPFVGQLAAPIMKTVMESWPGPNTWILPAARHLPDWLSGEGDTLAVRVTDHALAATLCRECRSPLVSTSANPSGCRPARSALAVRRYFPEGVEMVVSGALGLLRRPTRIRSAIDGHEIRR